MPTTLLLIFLLAIAASFIQRASGFGFGIFVMIFFPFLLPSYGESITLSGLLAGTTALFITLRHWRHICWRSVAIIILFNITAAYFAIKFMAELGNGTMKRCLGVALVCVALYFLFWEKKISLALQSNGARAAIGTISGIMGGMFAMPGPAVVLYCISTIKDKIKYMATMQALSVVFNLFYTTFRAQAGFFTPNTLTYWAVGLGGIAIGSLLGAWCFKKIDRETLRRAVCVLMIISGIIAIL
ncbi:MAG: sulfite exporter TauE/SafE family protein [Bacteroidaceae bacterium]|nr:sulfite exporter TauE/SafE family protein [Bacteroidaceae bacterium]